jgi:HK97 family phage major capsid protein
MNVKINDTDKNHSLGAVISAVVSNRQTELEWTAGYPTGQGERIGSDGGFLLKGESAISLMEGVFSAAQVAPLCRIAEIPPTVKEYSVIGIDEKGRADGQRLGGIVAKWRDEAENVNQSKTKFRVLNQNLRSIAAFIQVTSELAEDVLFIENELMPVVEEEFAFQLDRSIIRGDGVGKPRGAIDAPGTVVVPKENGQGAATLNAENVKKMYARLMPKSYRRAVWVVHKDVLPLLFSLRGITVSEGTDGMSMLGLPIVVSEHCSVPGIAGDIILFDGSGYRIFRRPSPSFEKSIHVRYFSDEQILRFVLRVDGAPFRLSPVEPLTGGLPMSEVVVLADRV